MSQPHLARSESDRILAGVCGGLATYLAIDSVFVRLAFLLLIPASGIGLLIYFILMIIMPSENTTTKSPTEAVQENINQLGETFSSSIQRAGRHSQGPLIAAAFLILLGVYFLFNNLGWLGWLNGNLVWPIALIGLGIYLLARRRS